jgi:hypothetical protein
VPLCLSSGRERGRRIGVGGSGNDLSVVPAVGVGSAALDFAVAFGCPSRARPSVLPAVAAASSLIMVRHGCSASLRFRRRSASLWVLSSTILRS